MPLRNGYSEQTIARNIAELMDAGRPPAQAEAIALKHARESYRKRKPRGPWPKHLKPPKARKRAAKRTPARKRNPATRTRPAWRNRRGSSRAFEEFHGAPPSRRRRVFIPDPPREGWLLGRVLGVAYEAERDGEVNKYMHEFRRKSAPLLVVSEDGKSLFFADGKYSVTDRGIEDR